MVRFKVNYGAHIDRNLHYLDYDRMKVILHEQEHEETKALLTPAAGEHEHSSKFSEVFFEEVARVDNCYVQHMIDLDYILVDMQRLAHEYLENKTKEKWRKKAQEAALKRSATTLHNKLTKLETYRLLNRTAAIKILKKHDKLAKQTGEAPSFESHMARVDKTNFGDGTKLNTMRAQLEGMYADVFCHGVLEEAQGKLRLAKTLTNPVILLGVAFKVGIVITLLAWIANNFMVAPHLSLLYLTVQDPSVYVYTAVGSLLTYRWLWGFCVYMWDSVDIDYILILDLDANKHMPSSDQIFSDTGNLTILYLINVLLFHSLRYYYKFRSEEEANFYSTQGFIAWMSQRAYIMPVLLVAGMLIRVSFALSDPSSKGVFSTKTISRLITCPLYAVHLRHTYAADILCSLTKVFSAILYSGCYFYSGAFLYASDPTSATGEERFAVCASEPVKALKIFLFLYPIFIRIMQCLRQRRDHFVRLSQVPPSRLTLINAINEVRKEEEKQQQDSSDDKDKASSVTIGTTNGTTTTTPKALHASGAAQRPLGGLRSRSAAVVPLTNAATSPDWPSSGSSAAAPAVVGGASRGDGNRDRDRDKDRAGCGDGCGAAVRQFEYELTEQKAGERGRRKRYNDGDEADDDDAAGGDADDNAVRLFGDDDDDDENDHHGGVHDCDIEGCDKGQQHPHHSRAGTEHNGSEHNGSDPGFDHGYPFHGDAGVKNKPKLARRPSLSRGESFDIPTPEFMKNMFSFLPTQIGGILGTIWVWPYSYNALRYVLTFSVVLFGAYPPQDPTTVEYMGWYIPLWVISTLYSCYWDVANDFKLLQGTSPKPFLREKLFYEETEYFYYIVLVLNPILRFMWTLSFTPYGHHPFLVCFEILRRSLWACMRMELGYIQELARRK